MSPRESPPPRPALRPGVRVIRRDDRTFQVGLDPDLCCLVADSAASRAFLDALVRGTRPPSLTRTTQDLQHELAHRGLLVDARPLAALPPDPVAARAVAAVVAEAGEQAREVLARRAAARIVVDAPPDERSRVAGLLTPAGIDAAGDGDVGEGDVSTCDLVVLVRLGEPSRVRVDELVRRGSPHLIVVVVDGRIRVGPFVVPGRTACLRCLDAHLAEHDPRRPVVVAQYAELTGGLRTDGVPDPVPSTLWQLALAAATDDVLRFVDGRTPVTWSATLALGGDEGPQRTSWRRHPRCGCGWGDGLAVGG